MDKLINSNLLSIVISNNNADHFSDNKMINLKV